MALVGLFAIFHGHAHGAEMPMDASGVTYALGFMLATLLLHLLGIFIGFAIGRFGEAYGKAVYRVAGGAASVAGLALLAGTI
jgi:urease accessory protein